MLVESTKPLKISVSLSLDEDVVKQLRIFAEEDDRPSPPISTSFSGIICAG